MSISATDHTVTVVRDIEDGIRKWRDGLGLRELTGVFVYPSSANGVKIQLWPKNQPYRWREGQ